MNEFQLDRRNFQNLSDQSPLMQAVNMSDRHSVRQIFGAKRFEPNEDIGDTQTFLLFSDPFKHLNENTFGSTSSKNYRSEQSNCHHSHDESENQHGHESEDKHKHAYEREHSQRENENLKRQIVAMQILQALFQIAYQLEYALRHRGEKQVPDAGSYQHDQSATIAPAMPNHSVLPHEPKTEKNETAHSSSPAHIPSTPAGSETYNSNSQPQETSPTADFKAHISNSQPEETFTSAVPEAHISNSDQARETSTKLIIPFPGDSQWEQVINTAPKGSIVFPVFSGDASKTEDFSSFGPNLAQNIARATAAGLKPIGYIGTGAGSKPLAQVKSEIDAWYAHADALQGIYLGGSGNKDGTGYATDPASEAYYTEIANYIHAKGGMAMINGIYGGGGEPNPDYINIFDVQGAYEYFEGDIEKEDASAWQRNYSSDHFAAFVTGVPRERMEEVVDRLRSNNRGYIWVSNDNYGTSPEYWNEEVALLS